MIIFRSILLRMRNVSDKSCRENQRTIISFNYFRKSWFLWGNVKIHCAAGQATDDNMIRLMHFACWITKATYTHSECVILIAFPPQCLCNRTSFLSIKMSVHSVLFTKHGNTQFGTNSVATAVGNVAPSNPAVNLLLSLATKYAVVNLMFV